jgi:ornithine cyclodeaminase/alanine dehydrogenase-like protein (mu-crystallin family)
MLFSARTGEPVALINDGVLQHIRVGGGPAWESNLSRPGSKVVGMIGSGGMARTYIDAFCAVRDITKVNVYSPNADNGSRYAEEIRAKHGLECELVGSAREAVRGADIVSCCSSSISRLLLTFSRRASRETLGRAAHIVGETQTTKVWGRHFPPSSQPALADLRRGALPPGRVHGSWTRRMPLTS